MKIFLAKLFVPLIRESVSPQFRQFLENWFFNKKSTGADLTKMVKIWTILNCAKKIFFGKIICSTHQRKCFTTILGNFWKIDFLTKNIILAQIDKIQIFTIFERSVPVDIPSKIKFSENCLKLWRNTSCYEWNK